MGACGLSSRVNTHLLGPYSHSISTHLPCLVSPRVLCCALGALEFSPICCEVGAYCHSLKLNPEGNAMLFDNVCHLFAKAYEPRAYSMV